MRRIELSVYVLLAAAVIAGLVLTLLHAGEAVYYIPGYGVGIAAGAAVVAAAGIALGWRANRGRAVALAAAAGALAVLGLLSLPPVLVVVAVLAALAARMTRGAEHRATALAGGVMLGIGLHVVALIALSPPLVDCEKGSAGENVFLGIGSDAGSGSATAGRDGTSQGRVHGETYDYSYACRDGRLVRFELRR